MTSFLPHTIIIFFFISGGLISNNSGIIIDHSTVSPELSNECHQMANKLKGVQFLDAPISGGPEGAHNGSLSIMVGGNESTYLQTSSVLNQMVRIYNNYCS